METMKLYVVVRADLPPGAQVAQSCHALRLFTHEHPEIDRQWYEESNNLVCLQVDDEPALLALADRIESSGVAVSRFHEPDYANECTALAIAPTGARLVSNLPLTLRAA